MRTIAVHVGTAESAFKFIGGGMFKNVLRVKDLLSDEYVYVNAGTQSYFRMNIYKHHKFPTDDVVIFNIQPHKTAQLLGTPARVNVYHKPQRTPLHQVKKVREKFPELFI